MTQRQRAKPRANSTDHRQSRLPGFTDTEMLPERDRAIAEERSPFHRMGQPRDVGDVLAFLAGPDARWITGQLIGAGGGVF